MLMGYAMPARNNVGMTQVLRADFEAAPESVPLARRAVLRSLVGRGLDRVADTTCLLTSELVTNAVKHAEQSLDVVVKVDDVRVRVEVHDDGKRTPPSISDAPQELGSYWLLLLSDLANRWGFEHERDGGAVSWFEVELVDQAEDLHHTQRPAAFSARS
jgi:anti-sigma regulatory factor (Ser/Thr protein kinase)